ncbi:protein obstructor-E [Drosophila guanche]|uniref:Blast:Peritrophin-1 n=1 Tax=Drosophila guanche TaxID=7266 RepID=A0A3B0JLT1_DROGU|nr:protein obstructor-E [Drosophila guanche]SPP76380.1 blast:Peritrophin-1 [Drosophila guanche]
MTGRTGLLIFGLLLCNHFLVEAKDADVDTGALPDREDGRASVTAADDAEDGSDMSLIMGNLSLCENVADSVFLPYVGDCNKYYLCRYGQAIELQCERPFLFNAPTQSCVRQNEAHCLPTCTNYTLSTFSYERTCTKYVLCYFGHPVLRECQDGLQYNSKTDRCDFPQNVDCVESECSIYYNAYQLHYVPSKVSCDKYFLCGNGVPREQSCAKGLYFSTTCNCCVLPSDSDCQISYQQKMVQPFSRQSPRIADMKCPSAGVHFYPHESRKDAYYFCVEGHGLTLDCSPGLWYDAKVQECREPNNVEL